MRVPSNNWPSCQLCAPQRPPRTPQCLCPPEPPVCRPCCPPEPPRPCAALGGYLVHQIVGFGEENIPCKQYPLSVEGLPPSLRPPYQLCEVRAAPQEPLWQEDDCREPRAIILCVGVPLLVTVRDADGCTASGFATLHVKTRLRLSCPRDDAPLYHLQILPRVRLAGCARASDSPCFDAPLQVCLLAYLLSPRAVPRPDCVPPCPPMPPLYPQPRW